MYASEYREICPAAPPFETYVCKFIQMCSLQIITSISMHMYSKLNVIQLPIVSRICVVVEKYIEGRYSKSSIC